GFKFKSKILAADFCGDIIISNIMVIKFLKYSTSLACLVLLMIFEAAAQNPLITNQYSADPSARVFDGKVYVYPSHDIIATPGHGRLAWFCMEDYHVFSSPNLTDWT